MVVAIFRTARLVLWDLIRGAGSTGLKAAIVVLVVAACISETAETAPALITFNLAYEKEVPGTTRMQLGSSPETVYVSSVCALDENDIESASVQAGLLRPELRVTVSTPAAKRLQAVTASHVGDRLGIVVDGKLVSAPIIRQAIPGNQLAITSELLSEADLNRLANRLNHRAKSR